MANINKFLKKGEKQQKTKTKTFRLTSDAYRALEILADKTKSSQNEIMNEILDEYSNELSFSSTLERQLERLKGDQVILLVRKSEYDDVYLEHVFNIKKVEGDIGVYQANYKIYKGDASGDREITLNYGFDFCEISELYDYGLEADFKKTIIDV